MFSKSRKSVSGSKPAPRKAFWTGAEAISFVVNILTAAVVVDLLHEHVGRRRSECTIVIVLPVDVKLSCSLMLPHVSLSLGQHSARAACGIKHPHSNSWLTQQI